LVVPYAADSAPYDFAPTIHLFGDGPDNTIIERASGAATFDLLTIRRGFTTVVGMTFDGGVGSASSGHGIVIGEVHVPGVNDGRVYRRIQLRNNVVRNCAQLGLYVRGGLAAGQPENLQPPISIQGSYTDCIFGGNKSTAILIEKRNTTHFFRGCVVTDFKGHAVHLDGCDGVNFSSARFVQNLTGATEFAYLTGARACHFDGCWFEETDGTGTPSWFMYLDTACTGTTISGTSFVRKRNVGKAIAVGATGACNGVTILNPRIHLQGGLLAGDNQIWILSGSETAILGGILEIETPQAPPSPPTFEYRAIEINDASNRSALLAPNRRLRLPRLTSTDIGQFVASNLRTSDLINRQISDGRIGTGLEALSGSGQWLPVTVNRYPNVGALSSVTSRDRGTLAWADTEGRLMVLDGTIWKQVYPALPPP